MCRYCPRNTILCLEPPTDPIVYCVRCGDVEATDALTEAQARHLDVDAETALVCFDCLRALRTEVTQVECALCERLEDADRVSTVDTFAGMSGIPVCHGCVMGHGAMMASLAEDAAVQRFELTLDIPGPLPTEGDWFPANDTLDNGEAA